MSRDITPAGYYDDWGRWHLGSRRIRQYRPHNSAHEIPSNFHRWSPVALEELAGRKANGETNRQIAAAMGRTEKAIKHSWEKRYEWMKHNDPLSWGADNP